MNPAILDLRPLGNTSKPEGLRGLCWLGQDTGSQHLGAESGNLRSSPTTLCVGSRSQGKMLCSANLCFAYKHGVVSISKDAGKIKRDVCQRPKTVHTQHSAGLQ